MKITISLIVLFFFFSTFLFSQTPQYPYPIIFVHGLDGSDETFIETMQYFESNFGWGPIYVYDVVLNADDNDGNSELNSDVKWDDFYFNGDLINVGRRNYNSDPDLCIDGWFDNNSRLFAINFMEERIRGAYGLLNDHFDHSNEAAINKQAAALKKMISEVLNFTGAEKVILVGHSMGGLAIREYLQRTNTNLPVGDHTWWFDQTSDGHKVAKVVTIGSPHYGFDRIYSPLKNGGNSESIFPPHLGSEAMRDMSIEVENNLTQNYNGPYLFSGNEFDAYQNVLTDINFLNKDINCDGDEIDYITGINTSNINPVNKADNPNIPLPLNIDYTWIVGHDVSGLDDGVVTTSRQYLENKGDSLRALINVGILLYAHLYEGAAYDAIIRGLDEPNSSTLSYKLTSENSSYFTKTVKGFITYQTNYAVQDTDYYKFTIGVGGSLVLSGTNISFNNGNMTLFDNSLTQIASVALPNSITQTIVAGTYYIRITGDATSISWLNPYTLSVNINNPDPYEPNNSFVEATPIEVGMSTQLHTIYPSGDIDYIKFNVIQGYGYIITTGEETGVDVRYHVYRNDQSAIVADQTEEYVYTSTETGVNYIRVFRYSGTTTGNYTIRVLPAYWNGEAQMVWNSNYEPNPSSYCSYLLPTDGVNRFNLIEYSNDEDFFRITASQGNTYTVILSEENSVDVRMNIYFVNADHNVTAIATDVSTQYQWTCVQTGTYAIRVFRYSGLSEGDYKIRVVSQYQSYELEVFPKVVFMYPGDPPYKLSASSSNSTGITWSSQNESIATVDGNGNVTPVSVGNVKIRATSDNPPNHYEEVTLYVAPVGNYEPNGNFAEATSITLGMEIQSHTINASGDIDYIKFNVFPDQGYIILTDEETGVDVRFSVYRNDQSAIVTGQETEYKYLSNETGVNYIRVYRYGGTAAGNYTIRVLPAYWNGDAQIVYDTYYEPNPNSYSAYLLPTDGINHLTLIEHSGDNDWFRINANQGDKDTVILSSEHAVDVRMNIYFENSNHSLTTITSNQTTQYSWTCSQTGTYMIYVYRYGGLNEGDYKIRVGSLPSIQTFQLLVDVANGWNMVSIPGLNSPDQNVNTWWAFRDMGANVFKYAGGYQPITDAVPGIGYWMKHSGANTYNTGDEWPAGGINIVAHSPLTAASGWNLIGGYEIVATAALVTTNPPGLQQGPIYKYSGGYQTATTLDPGYGYWIKLSGAGQIIIPETLAKEGKPVEMFPENWGKIILTDATGINYTLYAVKGEVNLDQYELPPAPPAGMFDIRFSSGRIAENINSAIKTIDMSGVTYPLTVRVEGMDMRLMDETGKTVNVNLKSGEDVVISDATISKLMVSGELLPKVYLLEQNYPNPFNPSTVIEFSLPEEVKNVKLSIYNVLGEKVVELVNTSLKAGKYQYQWNAQNVATGMYIYELRTDKFVSVKKMVLLK